MPHPDSSKVKGHFHEPTYKPDRAGVEGYFIGSFSYYDRLIQFPCI